MTRVHAPSCSFSTSHALFPPLLIFAAHQSPHRSFPFTSPRKSPSPRPNPWFPKTSRPLDSRRPTLQVRAASIPVRPNTVHVASPAVPYSDPRVSFGTVTVYSIGVAKPPSYALLSYSVDSRSPVVVNSLHHSIASSRISRNTSLVLLLFYSSLLNYSSALHDPLVWLYSSTPRNIPPTHTQLYAHVLPS